MDPTATVKQLRELAQHVLDTADTGLREPYLTDQTESAEELATLFQGLDQWLRSGGFVPTQWQGGTVSGAIADAQGACRRCGACGA